MQALFNLLLIHAWWILLQNHQNLLQKLLINTVNIFLIEALELAFMILKQQSQDSLVQVTNVVYKLIVYLSLEVCPSKLSVWVLRSYWEQVESPGKDRDLRNLNDTCSKNTSGVSLGKFDVLIVQILSSADLVQQGPLLASANQGTRKHDGMEGNIVLAHELHQLDLVWVLPPVSPRVCIVGSDWDVANWSIIPDIETLALKSLLWDRNSPLKISGNASWSQAFIEPWLCDWDWVAGPWAGSSFVAELLQCTLQLLQINVVVLWASELESLLA